MKNEAIAEAARKEVDSVVDELPKEIRQAIRGVAVIVRDSRDEQEKDLLGLFSGVTHADGVSVDPEHAPTITLFVDTLWDYAEGKPENFLQECRTTLLHEIGHYLGWNEQEVEKRGL